MKNKKGELTTKQLVTMIILIVSFVIVLFLLFRLNLGETSNKEICRNSVVLKSQSALISGSLNCRTNYLCISGGGDCEEIPVTSKIEVNSKNSEEIMKSLADEMSDCWWVFGEGKVDYADAGSFERLVCSICSIVEFDEKVNEETSEISYLEFYDYLRRTQKKGSQSYLNYLYSANSLDVFDDKFIPEDYLDNTFEFDKTYFVLTGLTKGGFLTPRWKIWDTESTPYPVVILERTSENYDKLGCNEFLTKA